MTHGGSLRFRLRVNNGENCIGPWGHLHGDPWIKSFPCDNPHHSWWSIDLHGIWNDRDYYILHNVYEPWRCLDFWGDNGVVIHVNCHPRWWTQNWFISSGDRRFTEGGWKYRKTVMGG